MAIVASTLAERPDLRPRFFELTDGGPGGVEPNVWMWHRLA
ncbi:hypothetical protein BH18ACT7_BH18ACT7_09740 [soil metagenome]